MTVLIDSYGTANSGGNPFFVKGVHPSGSTYSAIGQALTVDNQYILDSVKFYLKKTLTPTGDLRAQIYSVTGTVGTTAVPTGSALATSQPVNSATLTGTQTLYTFSFVGRDKIKLSRNTDYAVVVVGYTATFDASNYVSVYNDDSAPTHSGNSVYYGAGSWGTIAYDTIFYLYGYEIDKTFNEIVDRFKRLYNMTTDVTLSRLTLGSADATTGWHALTYTATSTIEMPILPKGQNFNAYSIGAYTKYNYTGYTLSTLSLYDKVTDAAGRTYRVLGSIDWWVGDRFAYNVIELERLTEDSI